MKKHLLIILFGIIASIIIASIIYCFIQFSITKYIFFGMLLLALVYLIGKLIYILTIGEGEKII